MFRLIQSLFGTNSQGAYPESLIKEAIERCVDGTDPWIRGVSGYRKKLRPAVIRAIDYVVMLVDSLPEAVALHPATYTDDRLMKRFFISADEMQKVLSSDPGLLTFMKEAAGNIPPEIHTLLVMEKQERVAFGAALSGDIVIHDVPQVTVSFDLHHFIDPSGTEHGNRHLLKLRTFDHLISLALKQLAGVKSERSDLERRRMLLQSKLDLLKRYGWGFDGSRTDATADSTALELQISEIGTQLNKIGGDDRMLETYLETVAELLGNPEQYLQGRSEMIFVDRMGIKREGPSDDATAIPLNMLYNAEGISLAVLPVILQTAELQASDLLLQKHAVTPKNSTRIKSDFNPEKAFEI